MNDTLPTARPAPLKLRELTDQVATASGLARRDTQRVMAALLQILDRSLQQDAVLLLPPLGRVRVVNDDGGVRTIKLRRVGPKGANQPLAGDDD